MHPEIEELLTSVRQVFPEKDTGAVTAETDIKSELDSLQIMMLIVVLSEKYEIDMERLPDVRTAGDLCGIMTIK